jgi:hypothetical protein
MTKSLGDIRGIYIATESICKAQQYTLIDTMLSKANVTTMTQDMMFAYLDATWNNKTKLKTREDFYHKCIAELSKRSEKLSKRFERIL